MGRGPKISGLAVLNVAALVGLAACERAGEDEGTHPAAVSVQGVMLTQVAPAADIVWKVEPPGEGEAEAVAPPDWEGLSEGAASLSLAARALLQSDLPVTGPPALAGADPTVDAAAVGRRIAADRSGWEAEAKALQDIADRTLAAVERKDRAEVFERGGELYEVCEACHQKFWYPGVAQP